MNENESPQFFHWIPHQFSTEADAEHHTLFPAGFTGFWRSGEEMPPAIDHGVFKSVCHTAARMLKGRVVGFEFAQIAQNFHTALIEWGSAPQRAIVMCNRAYFLIAFCEPRGAYLDPYRDSPELSAAIAKMCDWRILSKSELETPITDAMLESMAEQDRRIIEKARRKGWSPAARTVGDVIFHRWD